MDAVGDPPRRCSNWKVAEHSAGSCHFCHVFGILIESAGRGAERKTGNGEIHSRGDSWIRGKNNCSGARSCQDRSGREFGPLIGCVPAKTMQQSQSHLRHAAVSETQRRSVSQHVLLLASSRDWISFSCLSVSLVSSPKNQVSSATDCLRCDRSGGEKLHSGPTPAPCQSVFAPAFWASQHDACGRRVCCTAPCPWEWNAREWGIRASKHWLAHHRGFLLHLSQPTTTSRRNPSKPLQLLFLVSLESRSILTTAHRPSAIGHQRRVLRVDCGIWYAQAHSKAMLWQPRSPRTAAKSVTRRSALPPAASPPEGLRTASAAGGGGVNPPKETSQVTQIGSGSRRGCQSRESLSGPSRSLCSRRSRIQDTARPKPPKHACRCATRNTDQIRLTGCHVLYHPHADILPAHITPPTASMPRKWIGASACVPRRRRPHLVGIGLTCVCVHVCVCTT